MIWLLAITLVFIAPSLLFGFGAIEGQTALVITTSFTNLLLFGIIAIIVHINKR